MESLSNKIVVFRGHNHPEDKIQKITSDFLKQLKTACRSGIDLPLKNLYESVAKMCVTTIKKIC